MSRIYDIQCEYMSNPIQIDTKGPRISWKIAAEGKNIKQESWHIIVRDHKTGEKVWDAAEQSDKTVHIEYNGKELLSNRRYDLAIAAVLNNNEVIVSDGDSYFETGLFDEREWKARWIGRKSRKDLGNCPVFRKEFEIKSNLTRARLFISAMGLFVPYINGAALDEYVLAPGWSSYNSHIRYMAYDITGLLNKGLNAIGVRLGDGWHNGEISFNHQIHVYGDEIGFIGQLMIEYEDGENMVITDSSWKSSESGVVKSSLYDGEEFNSLMEPVGFDTAGFWDDGWDNADVLEAPDIKLVSIKNEGMKRIEVIKPVGIIKTPAGETLLDMEQNMVGWLRITMPGKAGDVVHIRHGEILDGKGNFYSENLRMAKQEDKYILSEGFNMLEPHFTYHGFRYVKILEFPGDIQTDYFEGIIIHTAMKAAAQFESSDPMVNRLWQNIIWGQRGNFLDVPTDCPQRDERLGWTGDAQIFCRTACFNFQADAFFTKWMEDIKSDQYSNGAVPFTVPNVLPKDWRFLTECGLGPENTSAGWGDAVTICPWTVYLCYDDMRILENSYDAMKKYIGYIYNGAVNGSGNPFVWDWGPQLGDWLALDSKEGSYRGATDECYIATAYYALSTGIVRNCARILGHDEDYIKYSKLYNNIKRAFKEKYLKNRRIRIDTQTAQIVPLQFGLLDADEQKIAIRRLVEMLRDNGYHLKTGFIGTPYLCNVLSRYGYSDVAYRLLLQKDFPSWLYQVSKGATTIWEHWDGKKPDDSFWSRNMNSFNHYAYGSVGEWIYRYVAGIDIDENEPGYRHILINPQFTDKLDYVKCSYESIRGMVISEWKRSGQKVILHVKIPANTHATIFLGRNRMEETNSGEYEFILDK